MIQELVALAQGIRKGILAHDALDNVPVTIDCVIDRHGNFKQYIVHDKQLTVAERLSAKKGKARLLVDKAEEVLEFGERSDKKHQLYREKLAIYKNIKELSPVFDFYESNSANGVEKARFAFAKEIEEKQRTGNIAFLLTGETKRMHDQPVIYDSIIKNYEMSLKQIADSRFGRCSICGSTSFPVADLPHGMIKRVPDGQSSGCALVSYNDTAYESYGFKGNENSSICTRCGKAYVDALNWLLSNGSPGKNDKGKEIFLYKNRKKISDDTAIVFWLRNEIQTSVLDILDAPTTEAVQALFDSIFKGRSTSVTNLPKDTFYAITLSGSAARIAIRDWIETSLDNLRTNLVGWFQDIELYEYNKDEKKLKKEYPKFSLLVWNIKSKGGNDVEHGRIGAALWKCAILGHSPPLWMINAVLRRIRVEQGRTTTERIALLKLYLNRNNNQQERNKYMATLDETNPNIAYTCGQLFAVLESIQWAADGDRNASIRERFFSSASTTPASAFGRLIKLSQHHLSKVKKENYGQFVNLDKQLQDLMYNVEGARFPVTFSLEDQASFAIGYYHQRQHDFVKTKYNNTTEKEN